MIVFVKILVVSDSHGDKDAILKAVTHESPDLILHLGDHDRDSTAVEEKFPEIPLRSVRGNCDRSSGGPDTDEFTLGGKRFFLTHGHIYRVKTGLSSIIAAAACRDVAVLLFGHTHIPYHQTKEGLSVINPGSIGMGGKTYAVLELKNGVTECDIKRI